ncbi:MAG: hypothetical protein ACRC67_18220 [Inquilinus sp.]|uniref:hypothetical protein n=1 Tax=Inquilinus sp. TaxID=1932117 RepID=UPI003F39CA4E
MRRRADLSGNGAERYRCRYQDRYLSKALIRLGKSPPGNGVTVDSRKRLYAYARVKPGISVLPPLLRYLSSLFLNENKEIRDGEAVTAGGNGR